MGSVPEIAGCLAIRTFLPRHATGLLKFTVIDFHKQVNIA